jgi:hypothetical protein
VPSRGIDGFGAAANLSGDERHTNDGWMSVGR